MGKSVHKRASGVPASNAAANEAGIGYATPGSFGKTCSNALLLVLLLRVLPQPHKKSKNSSVFLYISYIFISCLTMLHDMSADVLS